MPREVVVDMKPMPQNAVDESAIPPAVRARAAAMEAQFFPKAVDPAPEPVVVTPEPPAPLPEPPAETPVVDGPGLTLSPVSEPPPVEDENTDTWKTKFFRMQGQFNAAQKAIGELREQVSQMGAELFEATQYANRQPQHQHEDVPPLPQAKTFLTPEDEQNYGRDLIDFTQRAAAAVVVPQFQKLESENQQLRQQLTREARYRLDQSVEAAVPNFREIDRNPRWHKWLLGLDVFTGRVRQHLLNDAIARADAPRVVAFFRGFERDEAATGHIEPASYSPQVSATPAVAPREPAVPLATLAAPGRLRPAGGGESSLPIDKPQYTRAQIAQLYRQNQKGAYRGREAEWNRLEADLIAASREGRIR